MGEQQAKRVTSPGPRALCTAKQAPRTCRDNCENNNCAIPHLLFFLCRPATRGCCQGRRAQRPLTATRERYNGNRQECGPRMNADVHGWNYNKIIIFSEDDKVYKVLF